MGKRSRTRHREIASSTLSWLRLMLTCTPQALRNRFYAAAVGYAILVYFFPRRPSSRAKKNSLIAPNGTGARPKTSRIGHALSHEELFSHTFNPSWNAVLDFEKLRLRSLAPDSDHTPINNNAYQTPIRHPSDTYQTPIRHLSDTYFLRQKRKCGFTRDFEQ